MLPYLRDDQIRKVFSKLLKAPIPNHALRPGVQRGVDGAAAHYFRFQRLQVLPNVVLYLILEEATGLFTEIAGGVEASRRSAANRQSMPDQRARKEPPVFGAPGKFYRLLRRFERQMRHPRGIFDLFVELRILDHA